MRAPRLQSGSVFGRVLAASVGGKPAGPQGRDPQKRGQATFLAFWRRWRGSGQGTGRFSGDASASAPAGLGVRLDVRVFGRGQAGFRVMRALRLQPGWAFGWMFASSAGENQPVPGGRDLQKRRQATFRRGWRGSGQGTGRFSGDAVAGPPAGLGVQSGVGVFGGGKTSRSPVGGSGTQPGKASRSRGVGLGMGTGRFSGGASASPPVGLGVQSGVGVFRGGKTSRSRGRGYRPG